MSQVLARLARGARRIGGRLRRLRPLTIVALVLVVVVAGTETWRATRPAPPPPEIGSTVRVGVRDGDSVPAYAAQSRAELAALRADHPVYALVSLSGYVNPAGLATLVHEAPAVAPLYAYARVPLPDRQTELVRLAATNLPDGLIAAMGSVAERKDADAATSTAQASTQTDPHLQALYRSDAVLDRAEAAAYRSGCACVYALVVRAVPAALVTLAGRPGVRIVDPAPEVVEPGRTVFVAPLPEQVDRVTPPPDTGLPPG
jgi:hypothetical protein